MRKNISSKKIIDLSNKRIWIAGHNGMVGRSLFKTLANKYPNAILLKAPREELNLTNQTDVYNWLKINKPDVIFLAAAKVGGIYANSKYPVDFLSDNILIATNIINSAHQLDINNLVFLGSSCIYPKHANQPIKESSLLSGPLEDTNQWYAIAKIAGIKLCQAYKKQYGRSYICIQPSNLYGPYDNFHYKNSHVLPALLRKFYEAKIDKQDKIIVWGSGKPLREFLHVDDLSSALIHCALYYDSSEIINVGTKDELSIFDLAAKIANVVGFNGEIIFDTSKPDGVMRKKVDCSKINSIGWEQSIELNNGIEEVYKWFKKNYNNLRID